MTIIQKVINLISWIIDIPTNRICPTTNFHEDLLLDNIDFSIMILKLEAFFNISLSAAEVDRIETVKDASYLINRYVG